MKHQKTSCKLVWTNEHQQQATWHQQQPMTVGYSIKPSPWKMETMTMEIRIIDATARDIHNATIIFAIL
jgi:hypothetical protein